MVHILHQLLERTRSHLYHPTASNIGASLSMPAPRRDTSAPLNIDDLLRHPESFANDESEGNFGGGYSLGAHDGVHSKEDGYKAPLSEEDGNQIENAFDGLQEEEATIKFDDIDDVSSQPAVPYVGMMFDHPDDARKFYNEYAYKKGFGTRIAASRNSQRRGPPTLIKRVFECVHSRKTVDNTKSECTSESITSESTSGSMQGGVAMKVADTR
ncbi:hypothetical protein ACQ4PT_002122 [Festuca glaucescens]